MLLFVVVVVCLPCNVVVAKCCRGTDYHSGSLDLLNSILSVVATHQLGQLTLSAGGGAVHWPAPLGHHLHVVLQVSSSGTIDLGPLRDAAHGMHARKGLLKQVASFLCPCSNIAHWSWQMQLFDFVLKLGEKD